MPKTEPIKIRTRDMWIRICQRACGIFAACLVCACSAQEEPTEVTTNNDLLEVRTYNGTLAGDWADAASWRAALAASGGRT